MTEQYTDGPNTHSYRDASFITEWTLFHLDDPEGVTHTFYVPSRIVEQIVAVEVAASVVQRYVPTPEPSAAHRTGCRVFGGEPCNCPEPSAEADAGQLTDAGRALLDHFQDIESAEYDFLYLMVVAIERQSRRPATPPLDVEPCRFCGQPASNGMHIPDHEYAALANPTPEPEG